MKSYPAIVLLIILSACSGSIYEPIVSQSDVAELILVKNVNIFNGKDSEIIVGKDVLIQNGIIQSISDTIHALDHYRIIEGEGKTLMPGLIDAHVHLSGSGAVPWENVKADVAYNLQAYLYCGITTVYDLGGMAGDLSEVAEKVARNELPGPTVFNTHIPITVKNGHPIPLTEVMLPWPLKYFVNGLSPTIKELSEAAKIIDSYVSKDIDYVKIIYDEIPPGSPQMNFEQLKALIDEAHKLGKSVFVHIGSPQNAVDAVKAGADVLAHGIWRGELTEEQASYIAEADIPVVYTISGFVNVAAIYNAAYAPDLLSEKLVARSILEPVTMENGSDVHSQEVMNAFFEDVSRQESYWETNFRLLHQNGATILVGTDSNLPGTYAGATYFQELEVLKKFGMSNFEILAAATYGNSKAFLNEPDFGLIEEGKNADVMLLDGNPLEELEVIKTPELILKGGRVVKRLK